MVQEQVADVVEKGGGDEAGLVVVGGPGDVGHHRGQDRDVDRMLVGIVHGTADALGKVDLVVLGAVFADDLLDQTGQVPGLPEFGQIRHDVPDLENRDCLELLELQVLLRQGRQRLRRFQDEDADQVEVADTADPLGGQLRIPVVEHDPDFVVNRLCKAHSGL